MKQYKNLIISVVVVIILVISGFLFFKGEKVVVQNSNATLTTSGLDETENARDLAIEYVAEMTDFESPIKKFKITKSSTPVLLPEKYNVGNESVYGFDISFDVMPEDITKLSLAGNGTVEGEWIKDLFRSIRYTKTTNDEGKMTYTIVGVGTEPTQLSLEPQPAQ